MAHSAPLEVLVEIRPIYSASATRAPQSSSSLSVRTSSRRNSPTTLHVGLEAYSATVRTSCRVKSARRNSKFFWPLRIGETKPVQALGETRLAVAFHRVLMPDGSTFSLDRFPGLNQIGDAGLSDQVNQHYLSTFGAAAAVGLISGLAQFVGTAGLGVGDGNGNRTVIIAGGAAEGASQAAVQTMNRFLNRLPTITIREGHRIKVYLTGDLELPAYPSVAPADRF
jgi:hypothetical protein